MSDHKIIAIDGYSSSGKSTLAKDLAKELSMVFIDTGAMYRAVTLYFIRQDVDIHDRDAVLAALKSIDITFKNIEGKNTCYLNGEQVEKEIRSPQVSDRVSDVARIAEVRTELVRLQRHMGKHSSVVMDGRDIGTVVFPDADLKLFVTASIEERAQRRYKEMVKKGIDVTLKEVLDNLEKRDRIDTTREISPLKQAEDAHLIDNTYLDQTEQLKIALAYYKEIVND